MKEEVKDLRGIPLGIGPLRAGQAMAHLLATQRPDAVVWCGTAGSYGGRWPAGSVVQAGRIGWADASASLGASYVPAHPEPLHADPSLQARLAVPIVDVLTLASITTDPALADKLGESWDLEVMEVYAVALACAAAQVPFAAALGVTNVVGPDAHAAWLMWRGRAESAAQKAVLAALPG